MKGRLIYVYTGQQWWQRDSKVINADISLREAKKQTKKTLDIVKHVHFDYPGAIRRTGYFIWIDHKTGESRNLTLENEGWHRYLGI